MPTTRTVNDLIKDALGKNKGNMKNNFDVLGDDAGDSPLGSEA